MQTTAAPKKPRGPGPAKQRILAMLPAGWFLAMDAIHPESRRQAIEELEAEGLIVRISGSRDIVMSMQNAGTWDIEDMMPADSVAAVLASGVNTALRRLRSGMPLHQTDMQQMIRARVAERSGGALVITPAGRRRIDLLEAADRRIAEGRPARVLPPTLHIVPKAEDVGQDVDASDALPARSRVRSVSRAYRLAAEAGRLSGDSPEEHLGEAWLVSNKSWTTPVASAAILERDHAGPIEDVQLSGLDPEVVDARHDRAADVMQHVYDDEARRIMSRTLLTLTAREHRVLSLRYNLPRIPLPVEPTLSEIAHGLDISPERARQIEAKAIRKLRHPSRSRMLVSLLERGAPHAREGFARNSDGPTVSEWRQAVARAGGDVRRALWAWHGCAIVRLANANDAMPDLHVLMRQPSYRDVHGRNPSSAFHSVGDLAVSFAMEPGVAIAREVRFRSGAAYSATTWSRHGGRLVIDGHISLPSIDPSAAERLVGLQMRDITDHWSLQGDMEITGARVHDDRCILKLRSSTSALARGSGYFVHPMGLSSC